MCSDAFDAGDVFDFGYLGGCLHDLNIFKVNKCATNQYSFLKPHTSIATLTPIHPKLSFNSTA